MLKRAFTLVELIVVITILAILGTIAFISLQGYSKDTRDASRISDIGSMKKVLELYKISKSKYPVPSSGTQVSYSGAEVWTQGTFGESVLEDVQKLSNIPLDPLTKTEYTYSLLNTDKEYEIGGIFEGELSKLKLPTTNAGDKVSKAYITGTYNGVVAKVNTGSTTYVLAVPTIISSELSNPDVQSLTANNKLVYKGGNNLPESYTGTILKIDGGNDKKVVNDGNLVIYSGDVSDIDTDEEKRLFVENIQNAYSGTEISTKTNIDHLLNTDTSVVSATTSNVAADILNNSLGANIVYSVVEESSGPQFENRLVYNAVTYIGNGGTQDIITGIESYDINYDPNRTYTKGSGNNTEYAFLRNNFTLLKYIGDTQGDFYNSSNIVPSSWTTTSNCGATASSNFTSGNLTISTLGCSGNIARGTFSTIPGKSYFIKGGSIDLSNSNHSARILVNGADRGNVLFMDTIFETPEDYRDGIVFKATGNSMELEVQAHSHNYTAHNYIYSGLEVYELSDWEEVNDNEVIAFKSSSIWVKSRGNESGTTHHTNVDTLRGGLSEINSNRNNKEVLDGRIEFNQNGFSFTQGTGVNSSGQTNIVWQKAYHKLMITTTNHGKRALVAFDDVSNRTMALYEGSSLSGHNIPHGLSVDIEFAAAKELDNIAAWGTYRAVNPTAKMNLDYDYAESIPGTHYFQSPSSSSVITLGANNEANRDNMIIYAEGNSDNISIGTYTGNGINGHEINAGMKGAYALTKKISGTNNWLISDNVRGYGAKLYANLPNSEVSDNVLALSASGFIVNYNTDDTNLNGAEYLYVLYEDTKGNGGGSYADIPFGY